MGSGSGILGCNSFNGIGEELFFKITFSPKYFEMVCVTSSRSFVEDHKTLVHIAFVMAKHNLTSVSHNSRSQCLDFCLFSGQ